MGNYQFSSDILVDVLWRAGEPTDGTSDYATKVVDYLNRAYQAIYLGGAEIVPEIHEEWAWLRKSQPGALTLLPPVSTALNGYTVLLTQGNALAVANTPITPSMAGRWFVVPNHPQRYRVLTHPTGTTGITLDSLWSGATASGTSFTLYALEYALASDVLRLIAPMRSVRRASATGRHTIDGLSVEALEVAYPIEEIQTGVPEAFALVSEQTVRFSHSAGPLASDYVRVEYDYLARPAVLTNSGSQEPVIPWQFRKTLADLTLAYLWMDKEDSRAEAVFGLAQRGVAAMARANRHAMHTVNGRFGQINPRQDGYRPRVVRTESGFILGG